MDLREENSTPGQPGRKHAPLECVEKKRGDEIREPKTLSEDDEVDDLPDYYNMTIAMMAHDKKLLPKFYMGIELLNIRIRNIMEEKGKRKVKLDERKYKKNCKHYSKKHRKEKNLLTFMKQEQKDVN